MKTYINAFFNIGMIAAAVFSAISGDHVMAMLIIILREVFIIRQTLEEKGGA